MPHQDHSQTGAVCIECGVRYVETDADELCRVCWDAAIAAANQLRRDRLAAGWTADATGAIHPPSVSSVPSVVKR